MKKVITTSIISAMVVSGAMATSANAAGHDSHSLKVGVVKYVDIYKAVPQGQKSLQLLKQKLQPQVEKMQEKQRELSVEMQSFQKNASTLTKCQVKSKQKTFQLQSQTFQKEVMRFRQKEMKKEQKLAVIFQNDLSKAIRKVGKSKGYTFILNDQSAPYVSDNVSNVTAKVTSVMTDMARSSQ